VSLRWVGVAAAVAATLVAVLTVQVVRQDSRIDDLDAAMTRESASRAAARARGAAGARTVELTTEDGNRLAEVVVRRDGSGYFVDRGMPVTAPGDVYQLWALVGDPDAPQAISAGVLGRDPRVSGFRFSGPVTGFAVTEERAPGVVSSSRTPVVQGTLQGA
jgi:hypothetical protein